METDGRQVNIGPPPFRLHGIDSSPGKAENHTYFSGMLRYGRDKSLCHLLLSPSGELSFRFSKEICCMHIQEASEHFYRTGSDAACSPMLKVETDNALCGAAGPTPGSHHGPVYPGKCHQNRCFLLLQTHVGILSDHPVSPGHSAEKKPAAERVVPV